MSALDEMLKVKRRTQLDFLLLVNSEEKNTTTNYNTVTTTSSPYSMSSSSLTPSIINNNNNNNTSLSRILFDDSDDNNHPFQMKENNSKNNSKNNNNNNSYNPIKSMIRKVKRKIKLVKVKENSQSSLSSSELITTITFPKKKYLCDDMIFEILSFLSDYKIIVMTCALISKQWFNIIRMNNFKLSLDCSSVAKTKSPFAQQINSIILTELQPKYIEAMISMKQLNHLCISNSGDEGDEEIDYEHTNQKKSIKLLPKLGKLKQLTSLDLSGYNRIKQIEFITELKNLKHLSLKNNIFLKSCLPCSQLSQLTYLNLSHTNIQLQYEYSNLDYEQLLTLQNLKQLQTLDVSYCRFEFPEQFLAISQLSQLTNLNISHSNVQISNGLSYIGQMNQLLTLDISHNCIQDKGLVLLNNLSNLTDLNIGGYHFLKGKCVNELLIGSPKLVKLVIGHDWNNNFSYHISNLKYLQILDVGSSLLILKHFELLETLTYLDISSGCISDLSPLSNRLKNLKTLKTDFNDLNDKGAEIIANSFHNLTQLNIYWNKLTSKGAKSISQLGRLTYLDIRQNNIKNEGMKYLKEMNSLITLSTTPLDDAKWK